MRFFKIINESCLIAIGTGTGGIEISEAEYNNLLEVINGKPAAESGFDYRLKADLTWELYELPEPELIDDEEATTEDYEEALGRFGV